MQINLKSSVSLFCRVLGFASCVLALLGAARPAQGSNCLPPPSGLVGWWQGEDNAADSLALNNGTLLNGASFTNGLVGQAFDLSASSGASVQVPDSDLWAFGTNDFSIELWVNFRSWSPSGAIDYPEAIFAANDEGHGIQNKWIFALGNGKLELIVCGPSVGALYLVQAPFAPQPDQWYHLGLVRAGNTFTAYTNGLAAGSETFALNIPNANAPLTLGPAEGLGSIDGRLDEVSIYQRSLNPTEMQALFNSAQLGKCPGGPLFVSQPANQSVAVGGKVSFGALAVGGRPLAYQWFFNQTNLLAGATNTTLSLSNVQVAQAGFYSVKVSNPNDSITSTNAELRVLTNCLTVPYGLVGSWAGEDNGTDGLGLNNAVLLNGATFSAGMVRQAFELPASSGAFIQAPDSELWAFGTNDFSIELWANFRSWNPSSRYDKPEAIFAANDEGAGIQNKWIFALGAGKLELIVCGPTVGALYLVQASFAPALNQWYHLALVRSGNTFTAYTNGVAAGSQTLALNIPNPNAPLTFGPTEGLGYIDGRLDEISLYRRGLSQPELASIYGNGPQGKCVDSSLPFVVSAPAAQTVTAGASASFAAVVAGTGPLSYQWLFNQTNLLVGATNSTLSLSNVQVAQAGLYSLRSSNLLGAVSSSALLTVTTNAPLFSSQPLNASVLVGASATFSASATGSLPLSYQWFFSGSGPLAGATRSSLSLTNLQRAQAGTYRLVASNAFGTASSSNALLTVNFPPAPFQIKNTNATASSFLSLPLVWAPNGNENALSLSLAFDASKLSFVSATLSGAAPEAELYLNSSQAAAGKLGLWLLLPAGSTFAPGTQQLARVTFWVAPLASSSSTLVSFSDSPWSRQLWDNDFQNLTASYASGTLTLATAQAFEGDAFPRPGGDKAIDPSDWLLLGRYAAGLDGPTNTSEFQRADCAPRATLGNGVLSVADWVQAGRYLFGWEPATAAGGALTNNASAASAGPSSSRLVRLAAASLLPGHSAALSLTLAAQGTENALGLSLGFETGLVRFVSASLGNGAAGATLFVNTNRLRSGQLGLALALPPGACFSPGTSEVVRLSFQASSSASGSFTPLFSDQVVVREVADVSAAALPLSFSSGLLTVYPAPSLKVACCQQTLLLSWPAWAADFTLQTAATNWPGQGEWSALGLTANLSTNECTLSLPLSPSPAFYRLVHP